MAERRISELSFNRYWIDLEARSVRSETVACQDVEDLLGGIGRGFKLLEAHPTEDPYGPNAALVMNLGALSGTSLMTGLRTFFHAYSPLKRSSSGLPSAMWSTGSGKFGTKLRFLGIDEVVFTGRCPGPTTLHITRSQTGGEAEFSFRDATALVGQTTNAKIQALHREYPDAHFAVIGPAGENYAAVLYAAIALSSENQLKSGDAKARYCGRGGMGGVMGSKNLLAIVADTPDQKLEPPAAALKKLNTVVGTGDGSRRFREAKTGGMGGTWANAEALSPSRAVPEYNFMPTGTDISVPLHRSNLEQSERFSIKAEACFRCGISCHKNLYEKESGTFRAKFDYEPLVLLSSNIGIFDVDAICELVELTDQLGLDAISCGVALSYAMEFNRRNADSGTSIAGGLAYGDAAAARQAIEAIGNGKLPQLGQGVLRLSEELGETDYAMHSKGMEFPAYLPQTNLPGAVERTRDRYRLLGRHHHQPRTRVEHPARRSHRDLQVQWALQRRRFRGDRQSDGCQRLRRRPSRCGASDVLARLSARETAGLRKRRLLATAQRARKVGRHRAAVLQHPGVLRGASREGAREIRRARRG
jgi:aldehyde:ferredoxin oxidoreductase